MTEEQKTVLSRVLDMSELELRAALLTIVNDAYAPNAPMAFKESVYLNVDAAYYPTRRPFKGV